MKHPNATVGATVGGSATVVVLLLGALGVTIDPALAALVATGATAVVLFVGRNGVRGAVGIVWKGKRS